MGLLVQGPPACVRRVLAKICPKSTWQTFSNNGLHMMYFCSRGSLALWGRPLPQHCSARAQPDFDVRRWKMKFRSCSVHFRCLNWYFFTRRNINLQFGSRLFERHARVDCAKDKIVTIFCLGILVILRTFFSCEEFSSQKQNFAKMRFLSDSAKKFLRIISSQTAKFWDRGKKGMLWGCCSKHKQK